MNYGRLIPKTWEHYDMYPFRKLSLAPVLEVEKILKRPALRASYNQRNTSACVGFSSSWMMSIYNYPPTEKYNAIWLYHRAQLTDGDPDTNPENDNGTYVKAAFNVLRKEGHVQIKRGKDLPPDINNGIKSFYWCDNSDEIRNAISLMRPVIFGINWYEEFMYPVKKDKEYWIGTRKDWGSVLGGHAICCYGASDRLQGFRLINSWGPSYPIVYISYDDVNKLLREEGEAGVSMDIPNT